MEERFVDAPIDPIAVFFQDTADAYDDYLHEGAWGKNMQLYAAQWAQHYKWMDSIIANRILEVSEMTGRPLGKMNLGLAGPGFKPVGHDISEHTATVILNRLHRIIVIDFSLQAVRSAVKDLIQAGVHPDRVFGMQFDLTRGLRTMFRTHIDTLLQNVETEQQFCDVATNEFPKVTVDELQQQLGSALIEIADNPRSMVGEVVGAKSAGDLRIKVNQGEEVPLHLTVLPMVIAGTNAATESHLYERWHEATSDEARAARSPSARREHDRHSVYRHIHQMVAQNNSEIGARIVSRFIKDNITPDNPQPVVCALTDIATSFNDPPYGLMPRLHPDVFEWRVGEMGGMSTMRHPHTFKEAPDHDHIVAEVQVTPSPESLEREQQSSTLPPSAT